MLKLKDRNKSIPNGLQFYLPQLKWKAPGNYPSFARVCDGLQVAVEGNPYLAAKNKWPTTRKGIEDWVDLYNATICAQMGWDDYITTDQGASVPKLSPRHQSETLQSLRSAAEAAAKLVSGAKTLIGWLDSGEPAVSAELSTHRAIVCTQCPHNNQGGLTSWFTTSASELIRRQVAKAQDRKMTTPRDELLNVCDVCLCPLKLKCHTPIKWIAKELRPEVLEQLKAVPNCWVAAEIP